MNSKDDYFCWIGYIGAPFIFIITILLTIYYVIYVKKKIPKEVQISSYCVLSNYLLLPALLSLLCLLLFTGVTFQTFTSFNYGYCMLVLSGYLILGFIVSKIIRHLFKEKNEAYLLSCGINKEEEKKKNFIDRSFGAYNYFIVMVTMTYSIMLACTTLSILSFINYWITII